MDGSSVSMLLVILLFFSCAILLISNIGTGGSIGSRIRDLQFGCFGIMAYVFPVFTFFSLSFVITNYHLLLAYKKLLAVMVFFCALCCFAHIYILGDGFAFTFNDYYDYCVYYRTGGGLIGGFIYRYLTDAFGLMGGKVILLLICLVSLLALLLHSVTASLSKAAQSFSKWREQNQESPESSRERELRKELRARTRANRKVEKQRKRIQKLEEALAIEEEYPEPIHKNQPPKNQPPRKSTFTIHRMEGEEFLPEDSKSPQGKKEIPDSNDWEELAVTYADAVAHPSELKRLTAPAGDLMDETDPGNGKRKRKTKRNAVDENDGLPDSLPKNLPAPDPMTVKEYRYPGLELLKKNSGRSNGQTNDELMDTAQRLQDILHNFGVNVTVKDISCGPTVTRYELQPEMGVKVSRIVNLTDDIKLNLAAADIRIEAPIPGKAAVGIEVPNRHPSPVMLRDLLGSTEFQKAKSKVSFAVGKDIAGKCIVTDIAKMPHLLIAGATGSGKSVCINTLIISILYKARPDEVQLIMVDPKVVELSVYNGIPHLLIPVVTDPKKAAGALNWAVGEMTKRYNTFAEFGVRNIGEYNHKVEANGLSDGRGQSGADSSPSNVPTDKMSQIVIIVDELADLMMVAPSEVEESICRLAQLARAAGIHLVIATQRPSVNVITGLIKANMPSRIAFAVSSGVDSRTILDSYGAEKLLGKGDMLFYPQGLPKPARLQGAFVSDEEVEAVVSYLSGQDLPKAYSAEVEEQVTTASALSLKGAQGDDDDRDQYFEEAGFYIIEKDKASIGMLQRMYKIGFNRAARIMDQLAEAGVVGPEEGTKPRRILMSREQFENYLAENR